jgi:Flp pilus assembly protein TadG
MKLDLSIPNQTTIVDAFVVSADSDITNSNDPTKPLACTTVLLKDRTSRKFWDRDNKTLGKKGDTITIVVTTGNRKVNESKEDSEYYADATVAPTDFFQS